MYVCICPITRFGFSCSQIINETCVEIISATPNTMCLDSLTDAITVVGRGFTNNLDQNLAACHFTTSDNQLLSKKEL